MVKLHLINMKKYGIEYDDYYDDKDDEKIGAPLRLSKGNPSVRGYWEGHGLMEYNPLIGIFHSKGEENEGKEKRDCRKGKGITRK